MAYRLFNNLRYLFAAKTSRKHTKINNQHLEAIKKQNKKQSILRQFRQAVFRKSQISQSWDEQRQKQQQQHEKVTKLMNTHRSQIQKKATILQNKINSKRDIFDKKKEESPFYDYGDYTSYDTVHPVYVDRNLGQDEFIDEVDINKRLYSFIDKLPDEFEQKKIVKNRMTYDLPASQQNISISQYGQLLQNKYNDAQNAKELLDYQTKIRYQHKQLLGKEPDLDQQQIQTGYVQDIYPATYDLTSIGKTIDPNNQEIGLEATLSPQAIDTIYQLYLQGWNVRQISKRFGILPARAKFCVWVRAQLYHQILPKLGVAQYLRILRYQKQYNQRLVFCDYGLDLQQLTNDGVLEQITEWNSHMLDAQRKQPEYLGAMQKLQQNNKLQRQQAVVVKTIDKQNRKYNLKQLKVFRGKGSDQWFLRFKGLKELTRAQRKFRKEYF